MCWMSNKLKPLVSDGNVKIYKVCRNNIIPYLYYGYYYNSFCYKLQHVYKTQISIAKHIVLDVGVYVGDEGFHSYSQKKCKWKLDNTTTIEPSILIYNDIFHLHYINDDSTEFIFGKVVLLEGYIPQGATYYENDEGEIISDSIILTNTITKL